MFYDKACSRNLLVYRTTSLADFNETVKIAVSTLLNMIKLSYFHFTLSSYLIFLRLHQPSFIPGTLLSGKHFHNV